MTSNLGKKALLPFILGLSMVVGCASNAQEPAASADNSEAGKAIAAAKAAVAEANKNDWIWRDTETFLKQAEEAHAKNDDATAIKLANKARSQAELAVSQYNEQKNKVFQINR